MPLPDRPEDFSDEEFAELCEMAKNCPEGAMPNPEYVRVARGRRVGIGPYGSEIFDRSQTNET